MDYLEIKELYHHGIKGQKWGNKNGPPYPLDYDDHTAEEKKDNPKSSITNNDEKTSNKTKKGLIIGGVAAASIVALATTWYLGNKKGQKAGAAKLKQAMHTKSVENGKKGYQTKLANDARRQKLGLIKINGEAKKAITLDFNGKVSGSVRNNFMNLKG